MSISKFIVEEDVMPICFQEKNYIILYYSQLIGIKTFTIKINIIYTKSDKH